MGKRDKMNFKKTLLTFFVAGTALLSGYAHAQENVEKPKEDVELRLYTLDCGTIEVKDSSILDVTNSMQGPITLKNPCFVIQHGKEYMLWDAGFNPDAIKGSKKEDPFIPTISETIPESLKKIGLDIYDITKIGVSNYNFDHIGQANTFKHAKLYMGTRDFNFLFEAKKVRAGLKPELLNEWSDGKNVEKITTRHDVFGDGSVIIIPASGTTHGNLAVLINLKVSGPYLLTGDTWYSYHNYKYNLVSDFDINPEQSKRTMRYMKAFMRHKNAKLIINHEPSHIAEMPDIPAYLY